MSSTLRSPLHPKSAAALLVAASAGLLTQNAAASTFNEASDFSNIFGLPTALPVGTDTVNGSLFLVEGGPDFADSISISGLIGGSSVSLSADWSGFGSAFVEFTTYNSSGTQLYGPPGGANGSVSSTLTVPGDGFLKFFFALEGPPGAGAEYSMTIAPVPEAGTSAAAAAAGLAALLALRRRRSA